MKNVVVAMDCGGTFTRCLIGDFKGKILKTCTGPGTNPFDVGMSNALKIIRDLYFFFFLKDFRVGRLYISSAGIEPFKEYNSLRKTIGAMLNISNVYLIHDGMAALEGAFLGRDGILLISGTGSIVIGRMKNRIVRFGGWGHILGDEGSAYDIALKAIKIAIASMEEKKETVLINMVRSYFKILDLRELLKIVYPCVPKSTIAGFSEDVINCAKSGDKAALSVINYAADSLNRLLNVIVSEIGTLPIALSGGLFSDEWFSRRFQKSNTYHFVKPILSPIIATYWLALGKPHEQNIVSRLRGEE